VELEIILISNLKHLMGWIHDLLASGIYDAIKNSRDYEILDTYDKRDFYSGRGG
jgi:hypothetical protein